MNADAIVACFAASFSPNGNTRIAAELELRKLEKLDGMPATVLQVIANPSSDLSVRLAAAVYLKNRLARSWLEPSSPGETVSSTYVAIGEGDRSTIKQNILAVMVDATHQNVKVQLKTCLSTIVVNDFPTSWPNLASIIQQYIQGGQTSQIEGGLLALVEVVKIYRYRRHDREVPNALCSQFMPLLVTLGQSLLASHPAPAAPEDVARILHLIVKVYKISMVADLSPHQSSQQSIVQWGTFLLQIVCRVIPESAQVEDKDERERQEWWKAKKWAHHVLNRLYGTYGSPSQLTSSAAKHKPFATNFEEHFAPEILKAYLRSIEGYVNGSVWISKRCRRFILEFLEDCVKPKTMWQLLKPHLDTVIGQFVFPCMCLTEEEIEQFDDDPVEYSRAHFGDFIEDWFASPITAAITFLQVLVRSRKQTTMMPMLNIINSIVSEYPGKRSAVEKDGALRMLSCLAPTIVKSKEIGDKMQDFFVAFVFPEFTSEVGHLRARALDMVEKFEEVDMAWPDSARLTEMFNKVMVCMTDPALPVRVQAALALPELVRYEEVREGLAPNVGRLMQELLKLSEDTDIDALSKPTRALVTTFPDELLPFATGISTQMRDSYLRIIHEVIDMRAKTDSDDLFAGGTDNLAAMSDDADEKILVAMNTLQTLETLLRSVSTAPPIVAEIETILLPILFVSIQHEFVELYDDLFELVHSLTYFQRSISPDMWKFFEAMYTLVKGTGIDFIEEMSNVLDNYVSYGGDYLAQHPTYRSMLAEIFQITMASEQLGANDRVCVCKMAGQTLLSLTGYMDQYLETYIVVAMSFVVRVNTQEEPVVTNELQVNALELVVTALYYNPRLALATLQKHNHSQAFFTQWFSKLSHFTRVHDRKICILAITRTLTSVSEELSSLPGIAEQLLKAALQLFDGLPKAIEQRRQLEDDFGKEDESDDELASDDDEESVDADDDQDVQDEDNAYAELLVQKQRELDALNTATKANGINSRALGTGASNGEDDDDDDEEEDEYEEEEGLFGAEQLFETSLDKLDSYQLFVEALQSLQSTHQALFTQATGSLDQAQQKALNDIAQRAHSGGEALKGGKH